MSTTAHATLILIAPSHHCTSSTTYQPCPWFTGKGTEGNDTQVACKWLIAKASGMCVNTQADMPILGDYDMSILPIWQYWKKKCQKISAHPNFSSMVNYWYVFVECEVTRQCNRDHCIQCLCSQAASFLYNIQQITYLRCSLLSQLLSTTESNASEEGACRGFIRKCDLHCQCFNINTVLAKWNGLIDLVLNKWDQLLGQISCGIWSFICRIYFIHPIKMLHSWTCLKPRHIYVLEHSLPSSNNLPTY